MLWGVHLFWGVYLVLGGVPGPRGCTWSGGVPGPRGCVPSPRGCTWSLGAVPGPGGNLVPGSVHGLGSEPDPRVCTWSRGGTCPCNRSIVDRDTYVKT